MFPVLSVIVAIILGLAYRDAVSPPGTPDLPGVLLCLVFVGLGARYLTALAVRSAERGRGVGAMFRATMIMRVGSVAVYAVMVYACHWPAVLGEGHLGIEYWLLVDELVLLAPYLVLVVLCYGISWSGERRLELHTFPLRGYLAFQLRQYLLPVLPVLCFFLIRDTVEIGSRSGLRWVEELRILYGAYPFVQWISIGVFLTILYCMFPFLVRWIWRARPLPEGPLRDRLIEFSRKERFRARDLLVWPTGGHVLNAAVLGPAGPFRYVLFTDGLLEQLDEDEVEAVFAHEVGHAKHKHIVLFFLFTIGYALLLYLLVQLFRAELTTILGKPLVFVPLSIALFLLWFGALFGFISRRFEQQADVYGALSTGRVRQAGEDAPENHPFVRALEGLSRQMGDIREAKGWRHFPMGDRIEFLRRFLGDTAVRKRYRTKMAVLFLTFFGLLGGLGVTAAATIPKQMAEGTARANLLRLEWLAEHGGTRAERAGARSKLSMERAKWHLQAKRGIPARWELVEAQHWARVAGEPMFRLDLPDTVSDFGLRRHLELAALRSRDAPTLFLVHVEIVHRLESRGECRRARELLLDMLQGWGDDPAILHLLAKSLMREGRLRDARLAWETALRRVPPGHDRIRRRLEAAIEDLGNGF